MGGLLKASSVIPDVVLFPCRHTGTHEYPFHQTAQSFLSSILNLKLCPQSKIPTREDCPGGLVVKNPLSRAGDMGSSPGAERSHVSGSNKAHVPQPLMTTGLQPMLRNKRRYLSEKPGQPQPEMYLTQLEKALAERRRPQN